MVLSVILRTRIEHSTWKHGCCSTILHAAIKHCPIPSPVFTTLPPAPTTKTVNLRSYNTDPLTTVARMLPRCTHSYSSREYRNLHSSRIDVSVRLRRAVLRNDFLLVKRIVRNDPHYLQNPDFSDQSNTSLHLAAHHGFTEIAVRYCSLSLSAIPQPSTATTPLTPPTGIPHSLRPRNALHLPQHFPASLFYFIYNPTPPLLLLHSSPEVYI